MELMVKQGYKQTEVGIIPEDWKVLPMSELTTLMTNGFVGTAKTHYTDSRNGVTYIQGFNVKANSFNFTGIKRVTPEFHKKNDKSKLREGDLLTVQTGDVGLTTIVPKELEGSNCHALIISRFDLKKAYPWFYAQYFNSVAGRCRLVELETGTTMKHINVGELIHWKVPLPPTLTEQKAIATALSDVDELISSLEKLISKKKAIKQGAMQELLTGKKRLRGFEGNGKYKQTELGLIPEDWKIKELDQILKFGSGQDYKHLSKGDVPVYGTGGIITYVNSHLYNGDSIGIGRKGTIDKPVYLSGKFWTVDTLFYTQNYIEVIPRLIYYKFLMIPWKEYNEASGVPSLNKNTIGKIKVVLPPTITEQKAIAKILSDMDAEIFQLEAKRAKYQSIKQGMMQELLTGKTRLV